MRDQPPLDNTTAINLLCRVGQVTLLPAACAAGAPAPLLALLICSLALLPHCLQAISIRSLSEKLGMDEEATEKWIVNLVR